MFNKEIYKYSEYEISNLFIRELACCKLRLSAISIYFATKHPKGLITDILYPQIGFKEHVHNRLYDFKNKLNWLLCRRDEFNRFKYRSFKSKSYDRISFLYGITISNSAILQDFDNNIEELNTRILEVYLVLSILNWLEFKIPNRDSSTKIILNNYGITPLQYKIRRIASESKNELLNSCLLTVDKNIPDICTDLTKHLNGTNIISRKTSKAILSKVKCILRDRSRNYTEDEIFRSSLVTANIISTLHRYIEDLEINTVIDTSKLAEKSYSDKKLLSKLKLINLSRRKDKHMGLFTIKRILISDFCDIY